VREKRAVKKCKRERVGKIKIEISDYTFDDTGSKPTGKKKRKRERKKGK